MFVFKIRYIRLAKNLSLETLSEISGVNLGYLSQLERGKKQNPSMNLLYKIAVALDINIKDLFYTASDICDLKKELYISIEKNGLTHPKSISISNLIDLLSKNEKTL